MMAALTTHVKGRLREWSEMVANMGDEAKRVGGEDRRRPIHSMKVGVAMAAVSLLYYFDVFQEGYSAGTGLYAMWAVNTVAVVFEFSIGATIGKGVNRTLATVIGGALAVGAHAATDFLGKTPESILLALCVFVISGVATFGRFVPRLKARNDYCFLVVVVTYGLIAVSTYRGEKLTHFAVRRLITVLIGCATVLVCCCICPCWAGQDLHALVASNIHKLGTYLEAFGDECIQRPDQASESIRSSLVGLQSILDSKSSEETLANFARWEPGHGQFMYRHPWKQYLKIASLTRQCAYRVEALNGYLNSQTQAPQDIQEIISRMSSESGKALKELACTVETMTTRPSSASSPDPHESNLQSLLKCDFWEEQTNILVVIPVAAAASLLDDIVSRVGEMGRAIDELSTLANFKERDNLKVGTTHFSIAVDDGAAQGTSIHEPPNHDEPHNSISKIN